MGAVIQVKSGERIAQLFAPIPEVEFAEVDEEDLGETERETVVSVAPEDSDSTKFNVSIVGPGGFISLERWRRLMHLR